MVGRDAQRSHGPCVNISLVVPRMPRRWGPGGELQAADAISTGRDHERRAVTRGFVKCALQ